MLVQPATVDRWRREGVRFWTCRARPGRPRVTPEVRALIRGMATDNCLWGAPRIHGELLKLGITVSERTVSRYLRGRPRVPSQTWHTFLTNQLRQLTVTLTTGSSDAPHIDVDACLWPDRPTALQASGQSTGHQRAVSHWPSSRENGSLASPNVPVPVHHLLQIGSVRAPPTPVSRCDRSDVSRGLVRTHDQGPGSVLDETHRSEPCL